MLVHVQLDGSERVVPLTELEELIRTGVVGPDTPVRAEALTQDRWLPAGNLDLFKGLQNSPEALLRRAWANPPMPWFTVLLVGVQMRIFLWVRGTPVEEGLLDRLARYTPAIIEREELERLVTYGFFHSSFGHVAMNLLFIAYLGVALEGVLGTFNLAVLFFASVFWGGVLSGLLSPNNPAIGASAGDFGYLAAAAVFGLRWFELLPKRARPRFGFVILLYLLFVLINGVTSDAPIDNWAHLGGLLAGGIHMALYKPDVSPAWRAHNRRTSFTAILLMGVGLVAMARLPVPLTPIETDGLVASRPVWWDSGWAPTGESAWRSPVGGSLVVARTTRQDAPTTPQDAVRALLEDYRAIDPYAALQDERPVERDGVAGRQIRIGYTAQAIVRRVDAQLFVRGRYVHRVILDAPVDERRVLTVGKRLFGRVTLPVPAAVAEAREAGDSWRARLRRAEAEADIGDPAAARALVDAARAEAPLEPAPAEALLDLLGAYPSADLPALVDELLAAFPDDRAVRAAAVRALLATGDRATALQRLDDGLTAAPGDRKLLKLRRELFE